MRTRCRDFYARGLARGGPLVPVAGRSPCGDRRRASEVAACRSRHPSLTNRTGSPGTQLPEPPEGVPTDHRDHRVAPRHGVVDAEHDRPTVGRNLHGADHQTLRRELAALVLGGPPDGRPVEPHGHPVRRRSHAVLVRSAQPGQRVVEPVGVRARHDRQGEPFRAHRGDVHQRPVPRRGSHRQDVPRGQRRRSRGRPAGPCCATPAPAARRSRRARPRTSAARAPRSRAAAPTRRAARSRPRARPADRRPTRARCPPVSATVRSPRARTRSPPRSTSSPAAPSSLATSRLASRSAPASAAPERPTPMCAQPGRPRSSTSVSSPGSTTSSALVMTRRTARACRAGAGPASRGPRRTARRRTGPAAATRRGSRPGRPR